MESQEQVFGLIAVAEEQQKAVQVALDGLSAERAALAKERAALSQSVGASVRQALAGASEIAAGAFGEASKPFVSQLSGVLKAAGEAESKLSRAVAAFGWRWALLAGGAAAGGIVATVLVGWMVSWWQRHEVEGLAEQKAALISEVGQLQAEANEWAKRGGRAKLETCGDAGRLCVRIDKSTGYGKEGDYFVLRGY